MRIENLKTFVNTNCIIIGIHFLNEFWRVKLCANLTEIINCIAMVLPFFSVKESFVYKKNYSSYLSSEASTFAYRQATSKFCNAWSQWCSQRGGEHPDILNTPNFIDTSLIKVFSVLSNQRFLSLIKVFSILSNQRFLAINQAEKTLQFYWCEVHLNPPFSLAAPQHETWSFLRNPLIKWFNFCTKFMPRTGNLHRVKQMLIWKIIIRWIQREDDENNF